MNYKIIVVLLCCVITVRAGEYQAAIDNTRAVTPTPAMNGNRGQLTTITGPMFSGKTSMLIERVRQLQKSGASVVVFKPDVDTRSVNSLKSHDGTELTGVSSISVTAPEEIMTIVSYKKPHFVFIDEVQFFEHSLYPIINELLKMKIEVTVYGLDLNFRCEPFCPLMATLMLKSDVRAKFCARCAVCLSPCAVFTQRLINGKPAPISSPLVIVDDGSHPTVTYQPRCPKCHELPVS